MLPTVSLLLLMLGNLCGGEDGVRYLQFHYEAEVVARYGRTSITSVVRNDLNESQQLQFDLELPDTAFISAFSMQIGERSFYGTAKEKLEAMVEFRNRSESGENVGLVQQIRKDLFRVYMNTAANATSTFTVHYEELIYREQSLYRKIININPGDIVNDLSASIRVKEPEGFTNYSTSEFASVDAVSSNEIVCRYSASLEAQRAAGSDGVSLLMSCNYDVVHPMNGAGNFAVNGGYFAQFFSPVVTGTLRINLVLIIDVSGSMGGRKIEQARESLVALLNQLHGDDYVAIVTFSSDISQWMTNLVRVGSFRSSAIQFASGLIAGGGTALDSGLQSGISILKRSEQQSYVKLAVLLTDGLPSAGITDTDAIIDRALEATANTGICVNSISFGFDADFEFLQDLALLNCGLAKRIAESGNAAEELTGFLREISTPALAEVVVTFPVGSVEEVTSLEFPFLFSGSEIVVSGKFAESSPEMIMVQVTGRGIDDTVTYESTVSTVANTTIAGSLPSTERLRAYLKIKDLLNEKRVADINGENSSSIERAALQLSLDYNFVTELTSLIVVEEVSNTTTNGNTNNNNDDSLDYDGYYYYNGGCPTCASPPSINTGGGGGGVVPASRGGAAGLCFSATLLLLAGVVMFV